ncbi:cupin domain-containing protein [Paracoccus sp. p4-l81]|uniref:cupin domain-containing protein n=1 Tax=unclassified Paracoccus (in: a-proteobacteria) TaxID=2688777 RepID=UPI0035BA4780
MEDTSQKFTDLGQALRLRRRELGMTLRDVADQTGLSVGFISQLERGMTSPSLSSLYALAAALKSPVTAFFDPPNRSPGLTRVDTRAMFSTGGPMYEQLTSQFPGSMLQGLMVHYPPGLTGEKSRHSGEELLVVLRGALTVELDGAKEVMQAGDSLHFDSRRPHRVRNHTAETTTVLWCGTWDVFGAIPTDPNHDPIQPAS